MRFLVLPILTLLWYFPALASATPVPRPGEYRRTRVMAFAPDNNSEATVSVKPLDDPGNPYRDRYSVVDQWAYENYTDNITPLTDGDWQLGLSQAQGFHPYLGWLHIPNAPVDYSCGLAMAVSQVDENGYVIPAFETIREVEATGGHAPRSLREEIEKARTPFKSKHDRFWSLGKWNAEVEAASNEARDRYLAAAYPLIPDWAAALESDLVMLPDGGVIAVKAVPGEQWSLARRFTADGTQLAEASMSGRRDWRRVLAMVDPKASPHYSVTELPTPSGSAHILENIEQVGGRYDILRSGNAVVAVIDYWQDKEFDALENPAILDDLKVEWDYFQRLGKPQVQAVFAAQQKLGSRYKRQDQ